MQRVVRRAVEDFLVPTLCVVMQRLIRRAVEDEKPRSR